MKLCKEELLYKSSRIKVLTDKKILIKKAYGEMIKQRTHTCGDLNLENLDQKVSLVGWVDSTRDHGGLIFIDLRDRYGKTQVVFSPEIGKEYYKNAKRLKDEWVISVKGKVRKRPDGMENLNVMTGEIEIACTELNILNECETPPFEINEESETNEELRLTYRYLDLRHDSLQKKIIFRIGVSISTKFLSER